MTAFSYHHWRKEFGGLQSDQVRRLKDLEKENERVRKAVSGLTLEKLILREAASGNLTASGQLGAVHCQSRCVITRAEIHLATARKLFTQTEQRSQCGWRPP